MANISFEEFKKTRKEPRVLKAKDKTINKVINRNKKPVKKKRVTFTTEKDFDFLKYYIIVEYYMRRVHFKDFDFTPRDLNFLLFLYSEPPFSRSDFKDYQEMLSWYDGRLNHWVEKGIITEYKSKNPKHKRGARATLYTLSNKTKRGIRTMYDKLLLRYKMTERSEHNNLFRPKSRTYKDKVFAKKIKQMNSGKYNTLKSEDDYQDLNKVSFKDFVAEHNKSNLETLPKKRDIE